MSACVPAAARGVAMIQLARPAVNRTALQPDEAAESLAERSALADAAGSGEIRVASYNLYWWNVRQNNRWDALYGNIRDERPFDLIGFQECEEVASAVASSGLGGFDYHQGPSPNPCPIAWSTAAFTRLGAPGHERIGSDQWGARWITFVRLRHAATGVAVLFVNTHGPLGQCGATLGNNWANGVRARMQPGDVVFMTGDFNCGTGSAAMNIIKGLLPEAVDGGIDQILSNNARVLSGGTSAGWPSDHPFVKGAFSVAGGTGPQPPTQPPAGNHYRRASGVGGWGGWCTCPDGQRYNVGDNGDACASLACEGGTPGQCVRQEEPGRQGMKVTCAGAPAASCAPFSEWPHVDRGVTCGGCTALVLTAPSGGRCDRHCESFGHVCTAAAEEVSENCEVSYRAGCGQEITGTSDMLCTCQRQR